MAEKIKFYDVKAKKVFYSDTYKKVVKSGRSFLVAKSPSGIDAYRAAGKSA